MADYSARTAARAHAADRVADGIGRRSGRTGASESAEAGASRIRMGRRPRKLYAAGTKTNVNVTNESRYDSMSTENAVKELEQRANWLDVKIDLRIG